MVVDDVVTPGCVLLVVLVEDDVVVELEVLVDVVRLVDVVVVWSGSVDDVDEEVDVEVDVEVVELEVVELEVDVLDVGTLLLVLELVLVEVVVVVNGGPFTIDVESWTTPSASIISSVSTPPSRTTFTKCGIDSEYAVK